MDSEKILTIDCGTQSLRALVFDARGNLRARNKIEYSPYFSARPGWAEQDPEIWWNALGQAVRGLLSTDSRALDGVAGVALTTQRDSMVCVGQDGKSVRPAILWLDSRKAPAQYVPAFFLRMALRTIGMEEAMIKTQEAGKCNWLRINEMDSWNATFKYMQVSGYLISRLTGEFADSTASQIGHMPFDFRKQAWAEPDHLNSRMFPVDSGKLARLVAPGDLIGRISGEASRITGIPSGLPVIAAGSDKGCETIGMGVVDGSMASLSFGTTATIQTTSDRYLEPLRFMPAYPAPIPGCFNPEVEIFRGYWMITWFKNQFAWKEVSEAAELGIAPEAMLNRLLETTPAGCHGLVMQPYWTAGLKNPAAKGAIIGFGDVHERAHLYRAIIEGLAYGLKEGLGNIERVSRTQVETLAVSGGASQSDEICQISADIFNLPLVRGATYETSGLGAAMCGAAGLGWYPDVKTAARSMARRSNSFEPDQKNARLYAELYSRVYKKMYKALAPLYEEIRTICNYPAMAGNQGEYNED